MKTNFIIPILSEIILGYLCANYVISEYVSTTPTNDKEVYFLQISASDKEEDNYPNIKNKVTVKEDKYYTYIGMTLDKEEANKIKELYKDKKIDIYIKKKKINNNKFISELEQYDILLKNADTIEEKNSVLGSILSSFEEFLNNI